jgi:hypothetical protein
VCGDDALASAWAALDYEQAICWSSNGFILISLQRAQNGMHPTVLWSVH